MSFTCLRDEFHWPPLQSLAAFTRLWNTTGGETSWPPHIAGTLVTPFPTPPSDSSEMLLLFNTRKTWALVWFVFFALISSHSGTLTKINLSLTLKGAYIYKFCERILTWDRGDGEWSWFKHRHAEGFLESYGTFLDLNFLIEKMTGLDIGHTSQNCTNDCQYLGMPKEKYYNLYIHKTCLTNRLK